MIGDPWQAVAQQATEYRLIKPDELTRDGQSKPQDGQCQGHAIGEQPRAQVDESSQQEGRAPKTHGHGLPDVGLVSPFFGQSRQAESQAAGKASPEDL